MKDCWKYNAASAAQREQIEALRKLYRVVNEGLQSLPCTRYRSLAVTALEESCLWMERGVMLHEPKDDEA